MSVKRDVTAVGYIYLPYAPARARIKHLDLVGTVDHGVHTAAIDLQIIAHITKFFRHVRIRLGVDIPAIRGCGVVVVVKRGFVAAHVSLVEQVETCYLITHGIAVLLLFHRNDRLVVAAGGK